MLSLGNVPAYRQTISPAEDPAIELRRIKKAWLWPERGGRKVTIAIGLLTDETVVLAADREETVGNQKVDVSKFIRRYHKETAMVIAGAGPDCHIETMAELLSNEIKQSKDRSYESLKSAFRERLLIYYRDHVLCWPTAQEREDNDFNLLIALMRDRESGRLWLTRQNTLREMQHYAAIGIGATYARTLIKERFLVADWEATIPIAVDVIRRVKNGVANCGKSTEVSVLTRNQKVNFSFQPTPEKEEPFEKLEFLEGHIFDAAISSTLHPDHRNLMKEMGSVPYQIVEVQKKIEAWLKTYHQIIKAAIGEKRRRRRKDVD